MLTQLCIRHIVLIDRCDMALQPGLCVLSGETGAGKSILLDALGLVLGARADSGLLRKGEQQGTVTATFDISDNKQASELLADMGLEPADELIIRRTLSADGKTRSFVNDQPVTVAALKQLGELLVEVHGQHDQRALRDMPLQRRMLDDFAGLDGKTTQATYQAWQDKQAALDKLKHKLAQAQREQDYLKHMHHELVQLAPEPGEEDTLTTLRTTMMQSEKLYEVLDAVMQEVAGNASVSSRLRSAQRVLMRSPLTSSGPYAEVVEALEKAAIEAEEAIATLEQLGEDSQYDPQKLEQTEERLFALKAAARKYNVPADELPGLLQEVEDKLALIDTQDHQHGQLQQEVTQARSAYVAKAEALHKARSKAATKLEKRVAAELAPLKMAGTRFRIRIESLPEAQWSAHGMDAVCFECATNVGKQDASVSYAPLSKIASGGELSRFMLALKVVLSGGRQAGTLIFDEIDTGTGGAVAAAIGERLRRLGQHVQVLVVTHLPQVAAQGSQHLLVSKGGKSKVTTQVAELPAKERKEELARMLAGATITAEARKAAQKLLEDVA